MKLNAFKNVAWDAKQGLKSIAGILALKKKEGLKWCLFYPTINSFLPQFCFAQLCFQKTQKGPDSSLPFSAAIILNTHNSLVVTSQISQQYESLEDEQLGQQVSVISYWNESEAFSRNKLF